MGLTIHNELPLLLDCLRRWTRPPTARELGEQYMAPLERLLRPMLEDFGMPWSGGLHPVLEGLDWEVYRRETLAIDPKHEEKRLRGHIRSVENLLGTELRGEVVLFGAFTAMDGYARFHQGSHRVYLGVDESHGRGAYLDILITHELAHVARESVPAAWLGFGLPPDMTHDAFVQSLPVIEHLFSEGFSCAVSELLNPEEDAWHYAYQSEDDYRKILEHGPAVDKTVHAELRSRHGNYGMLYDPSRYVPRLPRYAHYVWAWRWVKHLIESQGGGQPRAVLEHCAKDFEEDALAFKMGAA